MDLREPAWEVAVLQLELSSSETNMLREVLESYLSDLHTEIAHTDSADFREMLKERKQVILKVLAMLSDG